MYYRRAFLYFEFISERKDSMHKMFIRKCYLFTVGSVCRVKRFTAESRNSRKDVRKSQILDQVALLAAVLRVSTYWESGRTSVSVLVEGMARSNLFPRFEYHMFDALWPIY
jgi:hypothetical protein